MIKTFHTSKQYDDLVINLQNVLRYKHVGYHNGLVLFEFPVIKSESMNFLEDVTSRIQAYFPNTTECTSDTYFNDLKLFEEQLRLKLEDDISNCNVRLLVDSSVRLVYKDSLKSMSIHLVDGIAREYGKDIYGMLWGQGVSTGGYALDTWYNDFGDPTSRVHTCCTENSPCEYAKKYLLS
jgi:hypothetical protein